MNNRIIIFILFCVTVFSNVNAKSYSIKIQKQTQSELIVEATFDKPTLNYIQGSEGNKTILKIDGLLNSNIPGQPVVPFLTKQFSLAGDQLESRIEKIQLGNIECKNYFSISKNDYYNSSLNNINISSKYFNIDYQGIFRDIPVYNLSIFPVKVSANGNSASWIKRIVIHIWVKSASNSLEMISDIKGQNEKKFIKKMFFNGKGINYKSISTPTSNLTTEKYKSGRYKILVDADGLYQVTYSDLLDAGMDLSTWNPRNIRLFNKGVEVALFFKGGVDNSFDSGDYFEFWGEKNRRTFIDKYPDLYQDPFTDVNVYWLENSNRNGLRMVEENGALSIANPANYVVPIYYRENIHFEEDNRYHHFGQPGSNKDMPSYTLDLWYYDSGISSVGSKTYNAYLPHPWNITGIANSVFVKTMMRGLSYIDPESNPDFYHQVDIWLNDNKVGESGSEWKNQNLHVIENTGNLGLAQSDIHHGNNDLRVVMDQADRTDIVAMNWFEISYLRKYRADNNIIVFRKQEGGIPNKSLQFEIDGFSKNDIELYKKGVSKIVNARVDFHINQYDNFSSYRISFQDQIFYSGIEYVALTKDKKKKPISIVEDTPWILNANTEVSLLDNSNSAEYLIITNEILYDNVLTLKQYHEQKGLSVEVVNVQDIYDEFNYGIKSPLAIKEFLQFVYENWDQNSKLYYVNLVGAASENYRTKSILKPDLVPTFLFQTEKYGASASDFQYSLISGGEDDIMPDLIISRIPAKNNTDFLNYFDKLQNYESPTNTGVWTNTTLMISGNDRSTKELNLYPHAFRAQNQRIINYKLPDPYFSRKLNTIEDTTTYDPNYGGPTDLINYWDDGLIYINFFGHGGGGIWADVNLFNYQSVDQLNNGYRLPFITSMTCFTGAFESNSLSGIAEKLINVADKGAIGIYASSGLGWLHNDFAVGWSLAENLFENDLTIGESTLLSKIFYLSNNVYVHESGNNSIYSYGTLRKSMVNQYNLLGEPYLYLPFPEHDIEVEVNNALPQVGDTIQVDVITPYSSGELRIEMTNEKNEPVDERFTNISSGVNTFSFVVPAELEEQVGYIKAYANNNNNDSHGVAEIAVKKSLLDSIVVFPENPQVGDSLFLSIYLQSGTPVQSVKIKNMYNGYYTKPDVILTQINNSLFTSADDLGVFNKMGDWFFTVEITDTSGIITEYFQQKFMVSDPRPDLRIVEDSFQFQGNADIELSVKIENNSNNSVSGVEIGFFVDQYLHGSNPFYSTTESFLANEKKSIQFKVDTSLLELGRKFITIVDYQNLIDERDDTNNADSSLIYKSFIMISALHGTIDTLKVENVASVFFPPNSLSSSSTLNFALTKGNDLMEGTGQPDFKYIPFGERIDSSIFSLKLNNYNSRIITPVYLEFQIDTSISLDSISSISVYRYAYNLNQWIYVPNDSDFNPLDHNLVVKTDKLGDFALFYVNDTESPVIEITMNGRSLRNDMLVPSAPELAFILQDENGINLSSGFIVKIDNDTIPKEEMNMPDSLKNANAISVLTNPQFSTGKHTLSIEALDALGNKTIKTVNFLTSGEFDVIVYGNYPNPFIDETYISYELALTEPLEKFWVKIYTVSGREIRKLQVDDYSRTFSYGEFYWDGRDDDGNLVSNGVYFAVIYAKSHDGKEIEHRIKMAKLK